MPEKLTPPIPPFQEKNMKSALSHGKKLYSAFFFFLARNLWTKFNIEVKITVSGIFFTSFLRIIYVLFFFFVDFMYNNLP